MSKDNALHRLLDEFEDWIAKEPLHYQTQGFLKRKREELEPRTDIVPDAVTAVPGVGQVDNPAEETKPLEEQPLAKEQESQGMPLPVNPEPQPTDADGNVIPPPADDLVQALQDSLESKDPETTPPTIADGNLQMPPAGPLG